MQGREKEKNHIHPILTFLMTYVSAAIKETILRKPYFIGHYALHSFIQEITKGDPTYWIAQICLYFSDWLFQVLARPTYLKNNPKENQEKKLSNLLFTDKLKSK